jgi:hypothetical protein
MFPREREKRNGRPHNAAPSCACQLWKSVQKKLWEMRQKDRSHFDLLPTSSSGMQYGRIVLTNCATG